MLKFHANNDQSAKICHATINFLNFVRKICSFKELQQKLCTKNVLNFTKSL